MMETKLKKLIELMIEFAEVESAREVNQDSAHLWFADKLTQLKEENG